MHWLIQSCVHPICPPMRGDGTAGGRGGDIISTLIAISIQAQGK